MIDELVLLVSGVVGSGVTALAAGVWAATIKFRRERSIERKIHSRAGDLQSTYAQLDKLKQDVAQLEEHLGEDVGHARRTDL